MQRMLRAEYSIRLAAYGKPAPSDPDVDATVRSEAIRRVRKSPSNTEKFECVRAAQERRYRECIGWARKVLYIRSMLTISATSKEKWMVGYLQAAL